DLSSTLVWRASGESILVREHLSLKEFVSEIAGRLDRLQETESDVEKVTPQVSLLWKGLGT
ncbi:MAG: hypothetical protein WB586_03365, partial [Chthoniobacterales bacterium]